MCLLKTYKVKWVKPLSHVRLFATLWTVAYEAPPYMGFSRQEYWSGLPFPSPGDLPEPGKPGSPALQADALPSEPPGKLGQRLIKNNSQIKGNFKEILFMHICWERIKFFNVKEVSANKFLIEKYIGYKYKINRKAYWWQCVCYFAKSYENKMNNHFFKCHNGKMTLKIIVSVS